MTQDPKNLVRTRRLRTDDATHLKHPMNPKSLYTDSVKGPECSASI